MKKFLILVMVAMVLLLASLPALGGCAAGVSQEEYDSVVADRDAAQAEIASLEAEIADLQGQIEVKTYTEVGFGQLSLFSYSGEAINVGVDQEFVIALGSNPTTGYMWQESYDETILELVEKTYELGEEAKQGAVGAGGVEHFQFKTLKTGETEITLVYKRPLEEEILEQKVFTVNIE